MAGETPLPQQGGQFTGVGRHGIFHPGMLSERLTFNPLVVEQSLALLGQANIETEQLTVWLHCRIHSSRSRPMRPAGT